MFERFRRSSRVDQTTKAKNQHAPALATTRPNTSFFDLPAELRNKIYEHTVSDVSRICIIKDIISTTKYARKDAIPALFITSRQCRAEYMPILLSSATISINISDFDFSHLMRITGSLYSTELKALRANPRLYLQLHFTKKRAPFTSAEANLRRWITYRSTGMDRLPWHYELPIALEKRSRCTYTRYIQNQELCMLVLRTLHPKVDESLQWELQIIMSELESQSTDFEDAKIC